MSYTPTVWENEVPTGTPKFSIVDDTAGEIAASAEITMVSDVTPGTPVNAANLNKLEQGLHDAAEIADQAISLNRVALGGVVYMSEAFQIQMGVHLSPRNDDFIAFPVAFSGYPSVFVGLEGPVASGAVVGVGSIRTNGFYLSCINPTQQIHWIAIGPR